VPFQLVPPSSLGRLNQELGHFNDLVAPATDADADPAWRKISTSLSHYGPFDAPTRAIGLACSIRAGAAGLGLELRSGLHTGEAELRGNDVTGLAVVIGQRISALADAGEELVSRTVKDLVVVSGIAFEGRGKHELKGVSDAWELFAVVSG
jgi:class 3 adenylate cyclase